MHYITFTEILLNVLKIQRIIESKLKYMLYIVFETFVR